MAHATEEEALGDSSESSLEWRSLSQGHLQGDVASSAAPSMLMMHGAQPMRKEVRVTLVRRWVACHRQPSVGRASLHCLRRTRRPIWSLARGSSCWCGEVAGTQHVVGAQNRVALTIGVVWREGCSGRRCLIMMGLRKAPGPPHHRATHRRT